ncbi:MAG TPA: hypothetical protein VHF88_02485 [Thermoleophilaceae bacterium]|nr:hypothetical protein [Thermoleophilaceae bacterium]
MTPATARRGDGGSEPASGLDFLSRLLSDRALLRDWLNHCPTEVRQPFTRATLLVAGLQTDSGWTVSLVLDALRCDKRKAKQVEDLRPHHLEHCVAFLAWLLSLTVAAPEDRFLKRATITAMSKLYWDSGCDLEACRAAVERPLTPSDPTTPLDLLALGAIDRAFAAAAAPSGAAAPGSTPEREHIGVASLDALLRYSNDEDDCSLAVSHALDLIAHISSCGLCTASYVERAKALGKEPAAAVLAPG